MHRAESLHEITQTASGCKSPLGNDSQIARCSTWAGCWTNLNAIYSWRGCDKAQASSLWNTKINSPSFPQERRGYSMGWTPKQPTNSTFNRTAGEARWLDSGLYTKPCEEEWKCVSLFIYLNAAAAATAGGEDLWVRQCERRATGLKAHLSCHFANRIGLCVFGAGLRYRVINVCYAEKHRAMKEGLVSTHIISIKLMRGASCVWISCLYLKLCPRKMIIIIALFGAKGNWMPAQQGAYRTTCNDVM